jgi:hypothetical protein
MKKVLRNFLPFSASYHPVLLRLHSLSKMLFRNGSFGAKPLSRSTLSPITFFPTSLKTGPELQLVVPLINLQSPCLIIFIGVGKSPLGKVSLLKKLRRHLFYFIYFFRFYG